MNSTRIIGIAVILLFLFPCASMADEWKNESGKGPRGKPGLQHGDRGPGWGPDDRGPDRFKERRDYHEYRGYKERPYDRNRHYGRYTHSDRRYDYHGHWRSWDEWDRYARRHPQVIKLGQYYRDNAHLMFRFCEPGGGACFFFSIGR